MYLKKNKHMDKDRFYYVYVLRCLDNSLYTGITTDVERRFDEHISGNGLGAKYTRTRKPVCVEAVWLCPSRSEASKLEYAFKRLTKEKKESILKNPDKLFAVLSDKLDVSVYKLIKKTLSY